MVFVFTLKKSLKSRFPQKNIKIFYFANKVFLEQQISILE